MGLSTIGFGADTHDYVSADYLADIQDNAAQLWAGTEIVILPEDGVLHDVVDVEPGRADAGAVGNLGLREDAYVVLITTDYASDKAALREALASPARYIGMIGSRAKCRTVLDRLRDDGYPEE